jgi:hypothetical protein
VPDPIDEEIRELLKDPVLRQDLERWEKLTDDERRASLRSHNEARRLVGLPPLPEYD